MATTEEKQKDNSRATITIGMTDVPWLDKETIAQVLASTAPHLRDAVKNGTPSLGSGAVYPISLDDVVIDEEEAMKMRPLPPHWKYMYGMDVGWNKTAVVVLAENPDTGITYVVDEYYNGQREPEVHAARIKQICGWMVGAIDPASRGRSQVDGTQLLHLYRANGLKLREADNGVEAGIMAVFSKLSTGTLKFFPNTKHLQSEYLIYRRDENGKIVKDHDHALDALRYGVNTWKYAQHRYIAEAKKSGYRKYNV